MTNRRMTIRQAKKLGFKDDRVPFVGEFFGRVSWPPSVNHLYATKKNGRRALTEPGKNFIKEVRGEVMARQGKWFGEADLHLSILAYPPDDRRIRDLDNILKAIQDGLGKSGLFEDDSQVCRLEIERQEPSGRGFVEFTLKNFKREK